MVPFNIENGVLPRTRRSNGKERYTVRFFVHTRNMDLRPTHKEKNSKIAVLPLLQKPKRMAKEPRREWGLNFQRYNLIGSIANRSRSDYSNYIK